MHRKRSHKHSIPVPTIETPSTESRTIVVKSHIRSVKPKIVKSPNESINAQPIDKHLEKPIIRRKRKAIQSAVNINDSIKDIAKRSSKDGLEDTPTVESLMKPKRTSRKEKSIENSVSKEESVDVNESVKESPFLIHSISKLVLAAIILMNNGNLSTEFRIGNLRFTVNEILHHSSGIIDGVDRKLYSKFDHINKPQGIYSNEAFNYLAKNVKAVIGMPYKQALNAFNSSLGTHFISNGIAEEIGTYDLSGTTEDLNKLGEYVKANYDWFANGTVKHPGRGIDIITPSWISKMGSMKERCEDVKITISRKKVIVERGNLNGIDQKYIVQQKIPKTKFVLNIDNKRVTEPVTSQPLNIPVECVDKPDTLTEIDGAYWRLVKTVGKTKYYQSPIVNSRKPFLVVSE